MLAAWAIGVNVNVSQLMMELAQRNIIGVIFGSGVDDEYDELVEAVNVRRRYMAHVFFAPLPEWVPTPIGLKYRNAMTRLHRIIHRAIQQRRLRRAHDLLSMLIDARYENGSRMTDEQVYDEARMLLVTGHETIGEALGWAWHALGAHPDVDAKLSSELRRVLDGRPPGAEDVPKLEYAAMILAESMRLYPPTWITVRVARGEDRLPSGARIPAGAKVYLCQYVTHRSPNYWPEPDRFDPDRFSETGAKDRPPFAYFPFGGGARHCIGEPLARMQGALVLATVGRRFSLRPVPGHPVVLEPKMTLRARHGIRMRVERRL
jgi:cytochrome P450